MALLQNEEFATWYMRTSYLANIKDGIGERLINLNSSILNTPGFRAAGWAANSADIKRTYSPPIPTTSQSEYFRGPVAPGRRHLASWPEEEEEEEGGVVTGRRSNDTIGPAPATKRRRRREQIDEEDSSDLSDESEDDMETSQRAAQQIKFTRMPVRGRADSSPIRNLGRKEGPEVRITSPSRRSTDSEFRRGSLGAVEAVKARARADTTTSSEMSSENEGLDPSVFARRQVASRTRSASNLLDETANQGSDPDPELSPGIEPVVDEQQDNSDAESVDSAMSSDFAGSLRSGSLLDTVGLPGLSSSSPILSTLTPPDSSPTKKSEPSPAPGIQDFPSPRPISVVAPVSLLGLAIRARKAKPTNPVERFAALSGKGSVNPLWIKIYAPFSENPETPYELPMDRTSEDGASTTVAEAIGLSLWRYCELCLTPTLDFERLNVNRWALRMVEDGEVDYDFPALSRTRPMTDFTSNNNRGARARSRERVYDEFALVEANATQFEENQKLTPKYNAAAITNPDGADIAEPEDTATQPSTGRLLPTQLTRPVLGQPFASALDNTSLRPADMPEQTSYATRRMGVMKTLTIRYLDMDVTMQATSMDIVSDSYIAEILEHVCKLWNLDQAGYSLRVSGTNTVAPLDRTIEALGTRSDLDLVRRRFGTGSFHLTGSPGSASPNAPLLIDIDGPKKSGGGKRSMPMLHPLAQKQDLISSAANFKRYPVTRKHLTTAFSSQASHKRTLVLDADYMHIMPFDNTTTATKGTVPRPTHAYAYGHAPAATAATAAISSYAYALGPDSKTTSIPFADIVQTKVSTRHPKLFRVIVRRAGETKRYDFEARDVREAAEIVEDIKRVMVPQ